MNSLSERISSLLEVIEKLNTFILKRKSSEDFSPTDDFEIKWNATINQTKLENPWFTERSIMHCLTYWVQHLTKSKLEDWLNNYHLTDLHSNKKVGLILAGNIPMVGFHDVLCVVLTGNFAKIKLSSKDAKLIPQFLNSWKEILPSLNFEFVEKLENYDAIIATGSENTSTYFEYYFKDVPHIIRKNRTSIAILTGNETNEEIQALADDVFLYFGLGCRNVTQLFVPKGFKVDKLYENFYKYSEYANHFKYSSNYDYHKAIFLLNQEKFWDNNLLLIKESDELFSPLSVLFLNTYDSILDVVTYISKKQEKIQAVVTNSEMFENKIPLGQSQNPELNTYADEVDTVQFLLSL
jgi:hypothetical protein